MSDPRVSTAVLEDWLALLPQSVKQKRNDRTLSLCEFTEALENAAKQHEKPWLGWAMGSNCNYLTRGNVGKAILGASNLGVGLHWLCRFYPLIQDATQLKLETHQNMATLSYKIIDPNIWQREQDALYTLSIFASVIRQAEPGIWSQVKINLEASKKSSHSELYRQIQAPISYGHQANEIVFPAKYLKSSIGQGEQGFTNTINDLTRELTRKNRSMSIVDRARYIIFLGLQETIINQDYVARELGYSTRTLRRKLSSAGMSYQSLLDDCRMEFAAREIRKTEHFSFSQMALKLGYSEHSTFTRAFCRWSGMTPRHFRSLHTDMRGFA